MMLKAMSKKATLMLVLMKKATMKVATMIPAKLLWRESYVMKSPS